MSRVLKFRAWDNKQKKMLYGVSIGTIKVWDENAPLISHEFSYSEDCIFEQYTGLTDKNGKEIYEGDIVTLNGEWEEIEHDDCSIVTFENGCFRVGDGYENEAGSYLSDWRIIGNIHENPELLKEEK